MKKLLSIVFLFAALPLLAHAGNLSQLLQLADYVGVDYGGAVRNGEIINPGEYNEMRDFSTAIHESVSALPRSPGKERMIALADKLAGLVETRGDANEVMSVTAEIRQALINGYDIPVSPSRIPDLTKAAQLYTQQCAGCHGMDGYGNGPIATSMDPAPTNFHDSERARQRSLLGLYTTITRGVEGTAMPSHAGLSEDDRWSLAFHVGSLWAPSGLAAQGRAMLERGSVPDQLGKLATMTTLSPAEIAARYGREGVAVLAYQRKHPESLFTATGGHPLDFTAARLAESSAQYANGNKSAAYQLAVKSYLEGFELVEGNLDAVDPALRKEIEGEMTAYRNLIRHEADRTQVSAREAHIQALVATAKTRLSTTTLSGSTAFASATVILLREGLEALLVVAALAAFLLKTGRRDGLHYLYAGIGAALALGVLTWVASNTVIDISGQQRELTEGFAALFAAVMLFGVGFWMHSKTSAAQWKHFIETNLRKHLNQGTLWGISGLAFIAVYREIFEVVLFYQALWAQSDKGAQGLIVGGMLVAAGALLVLGWLILRYSTRLPLRQFFAASGIFMFVLAFIFTGKGIAALQEAGQLPISQLDVPGIAVLGIYPNIETMTVQAALLLITFILLTRQNGRAQTEQGNG